MNMEILKNETQLNTPDNKGKVGRMNSFNTKINKSTTKNIDSMNLNEINELIASTRHFKHNYSRSTSLSYVPLTKHQKLTMIEEMNTNSNNKLMKYSGIFNEIKNQITDLSLSLKVNFNEKKSNSKHKGSAQMLYHFKENNQINEELDEEMTTLSIQKTIHFPRDTSLIDENNIGEVDEKKTSIFVNSTKRQNENNNKLFEKVKLKTPSNRKKLLMQQGKINNRRRTNLIPREDYRSRENELGSTIKNNTNQSKKVSFNNTAKVQLQTEEASIAVDSCQCILF